MRLREAARFSDTACKLLIVDWKRFWMAPSVLRRVLTEVRAESHAGWRRSQRQRVSTFTVVRLPSEPESVRQPSRRGQSHPHRLQ